MGDHSAKKEKRKMKKLLTCNNPDVSPENYAEGKIANTQKSHRVWFHLHNVLEKAELSMWQKASGDQG